MAYLRNRDYDYGLEDVWKRTADDDMAKKFPTGTAFTGPDPFNRMAVTCRRCGECGLRWRKTSAGWRLFPEGATKAHHCKGA